MPITNTTRSSGDELSFENAYWGIKIAPAVAFVDVSQYGFQISPAEQSVETSEEKMFQGPAIVATSAAGTVAYTFSALVTAATTELYMNVEAEWRTAANGRVADFQYGNTAPGTGVLTHESTGGKITAFTYPAADANNAESGRFSFTITAGSITPSIGA